VPHAPLLGRIETAVAHALEAHRAELAALVEQHVAAEPERLVAELVADALARRNGDASKVRRSDLGRRRRENVRRSDIFRAQRRRRKAPRLGAFRAEELRRCSTCRRELSASAFGRDARRADACAAGAAIAGRAASTPVRSARVGEHDANRRPQDDGTAHGTTRSLDRWTAAESGRAALNAPGPGEHVPTVDEWLLDAGLAERNGRGLVATELGLELGAALDDSLAAIA
jgi:hypothetical protein